MFHIKFIGIFMIYLHTKFHILISISALVIAMKPNIKSIWLL